MHNSKEIKSQRVAVIGGGAAGCFAAIIMSQIDPTIKVVLFEKSNALLGKVKISGGGRCNVTHYCFDPSELVRYYPRGSRELLGPLHRFGPGDMMQWLEQNGVALKHEIDGRVFPCSDRSETVIECFIDQIVKNNIIVNKNSNIHKLECKDEGTWRAFLGTTIEEFDRVLIATGGSHAIWEFLKSIGMNIIEPVPSLFTFIIDDIRMKGLAGISMPNTILTVQGTKLSASGPLLITHKGISGPGVLALSSKAARELHALNYQFSLEINYTGVSESEIIEQLLDRKKVMAGKKVYSSPAPFGFPSRLWMVLCISVGIKEDKNWGDVSDKLIKALSSEISSGKYEVKGKNTFKEEFVTAGGVCLKEINFKTMEAKRFPGLYFAGEVLNIDALTGGYNFQAAWTTAWIAAQGITGTT